MSDPINYARGQKERFEQELFDFLRIPSVSADPAHEPDIQAASGFVRDRLADAGLDVEIIPTTGNPLVYGEWLGAPGAPTVLIYGHYDVQPPDPLDLWISGPFEPTVRDGNVYARGATDDKGQLYTHIKGIESWLRSAGRLPINVKVVIEGEEEVGSEAIDRALPGLADRLKCDHVVISDSSMFSPDIPAITYGIRGICYAEILVEGPVRDLHSGTFGGSVQNPLNALCEILAGLVDASGRIQIPGFYDDVAPMSDHERQTLAQLPWSDEDYQRELGVDALFGEEGYSTIERRGCRPTCDVNGIWGGYQGKGAKTVLPARAGAKVSFRLVPDQKIDKIQSGLSAFIDAHRPAGVRTKLILHHGAEAVTVPLGSPGIMAAARALEKAFDQEPVYIREGGSIPIVSSFKRVLGADSLLLGFGQNDDNTHSPNEKFSLTDFHRGILASVHLMEELSAT